MWKQGTLIVVIATICKLFIKKIGAIEGIEFLDSNQIDAIPEWKIENVRIQSNNFRNIIHITIRSCSILNLKKGITVKVVIYKMLWIFHRFLAARHSISAIDDSNFYKFN